MSYLLSQGSGTEVLQGQSVVGSSCLCPWKVCILLELQTLFICTHYYIFPKISNSRKVFSKNGDSRVGKHSWERRRVIYSEAELCQISEYSNKCLTFLTHFLERDSGLRNKVSKLRSLIISALKMTWWLVGLLKVYARNSLASQGSRVEADKITWGTGAACLTPLALSSENISSWHEDESSSLWES